ncbi:unnamed protein product [Caenorhabditis brenneri]
MSSKLLLIPFLLLLHSTVSYCFDDKEEEIDCVLTCGDDVEEWKKCAQECYGDFMDDSDHTFLACENNCVDTLYKPDKDESELKDFEECAQKCVDDYREDEGGKERKLVF